MKSTKISDLIKPKVPEEPPSNINDEDVLNNELQNQLYDLKLELSQLKDTEKKEIKSYEDEDEDEIDEIGVDVDEYDMKLRNDLHGKTEHADNMVTIKTMNFLVCIFATYILLNSKYVSKLIENSLPYFLYNKAFGIKAALYTLIIYLLLMFTSGILF